MKICFILGTRPEIIKMAPLIRECETQGIDFFIIHSGQHYSASLDAIFFTQLKLPRPKYALKVGRTTRLQRMAKLLPALEKIVSQEKPTILLVEGDTDTVLAGALTGVTLQVPVGHVEAGLRSYFRGMPEEMNRVLTDHYSDLLFAPTLLAQKILRKEGIPPSHIFVVGNTVVDALRQHVNLSISQKSLLKNLRIEPRKYCLATVHRAENVDNKKRITGILEGLKRVGDQLGMNIFLPLHPRTKKRIKEFCLQIPDRIICIPPLGYLEFLFLESNAALLLTDSGGVQEEACVLQIPCVTLRDNTERPETVSLGANMLVGTDPKIILAGAVRMYQAKRSWQQPFGDGRAAKKIIHILKKRFS